MNDLRNIGDPANVDPGVARSVIGAIVVAAVASAIGAYSYEAGLWQQPPKTNEIVADDQLPTG